MENLTIPHLLRIILFQNSTISDGVAVLIRISRRSQPILRAVPEKDATGWNGSWKQLLVLTKYPKLNVSKVNSCFNKPPCMAYEKPPIHCNILVREDSLTLFYVQLWAEYVWFLLIASSFQYGSTSIKISPFVHLWQLLGLMSFLCAVRYVFILMYVCMYSVNMCFLPDRLDLHLTFKISIWVLQLI